MARFSASRHFWTWPVLVPLVGILVLAGLGWREADRAQGTAELLMFDYASFIAEGFLKEAAHDFSQATGLSSYDPQYDRPGHVHPVSWLRSVLAEGEPLPKVPPHSDLAEYFFSYDPDSGRLETTPSGVPDLELTRLRSALKMVPRNCPISTVVSFPSMGDWLPDPGTDWTALVKTDRRGKAVRIAGFRAPTRVLVERILKPLIENRDCACPPSMIPESLRPTRDIRAVASFIVRDASGTVQFQSQPQYAAMRAVTKPFPTSVPLAGWTIEARLNPAAVRPLLPYAGRSLPWPAVFVISILAVSVGLISVRAQRRHGELLKLRETFVANVSHDLKTPLARVRLFNDLLRREKPVAGDVRERYRNIIDRECRRLGMLVDNVLDFARSERGAGAYQMSPLDLSRLTGEALESFRAASNPESFLLEVELAEGVTVRGDRESLQQLIINLLDNAVKHSGKGCRVGVRVEAKGSRAVLAVQDDGPGIAKVDQERIFEPFYRVQQEEQQSISGSGLGLALVRQIAEAHQGEVRVESSPGKGSRFVVTLPRFEAAEVGDR